MAIIDTASLLDHTPAVRGGWFRGGLWDDVCRLPRPVQNAQAAVSSEHEPDDGRDHVFQIFLDLLWSPDRVATGDCLE
jgi:hypothetical protein